MGNGVSHKHSYSSSKSIGNINSFARIYIGAQGVRINNLVGFYYLYFIYGRFSIEFSIGREQRQVVLYQHSRNFRNLPFEDLRMQSTLSSTV